MFNDPLGVHTISNPHLPATANVDPKTTDVKSKTKSSVNTHLDKSQKLSLRGTFLFPNSNFITDNNTVSESSSTSGASSSSAAPTTTPQSEQEIDLLPGEIFLAKPILNAILLPSLINFNLTTISSLPLSSCIEGKLYITNYKLYFKRAQRTDLFREDDTWVPVTTIERIRILQIDRPPSSAKGANVLSDQYTTCLELQCKDFRTIFVAYSKNEFFYSLLKRTCFPGDFRKTFAFSYQYPESSPTIQLLKEILDSPKTLSPTNSNPFLSREQNGVEDTINSTELKSLLQTFLGSATPSSLRASSSERSFEQSESPQQQVSEQGQPATEQVSVEQQEREEERGRKLRGWWLNSSCLSEYIRQGVLNLNSWWRLCEVNRNFSVCPTYPDLWVVPKQLNDDIIRAAALFRSKGRLPILSYRHPYNQATITRSAQPLVGLQGSRSEFDERLLRAIREATPTGQLNPDIPLYIIDARPKANAVTNQALNGGYENTKFYKNSEIRFMGIGNIHVMRESLRKLRQACLSPSLSSNIADSKWNSSIDSSGWLEHIKLVLSASIEMVELIHFEKASILCHCSDGWDRTSQLVSLSSIMLDPYYRTIEGLIVLLEKEWFSMGHKFSERIGHADENSNNDQRAPIFAQFVDCLFQLSSQFPTSFEYNENLMLFLMDELYGCRFGNFMCDHLLERYETKLFNSTFSMWVYVLDNLKLFTNLFYDPSRNKTEIILIPNLSTTNVKLWSNYYLRYHPNFFPDSVKLFGGLKVKCKQKDLQKQAMFSQKYFDLIKENELLKKEKEKLLALREMKKRIKHERDIERVIQKEIETKTKIKSNKKNKSEPVLEKQSDNSNHNNNNNNNNNNSPSLTSDLQNTQNTVTETKTNESKSESEQQNNCNTIERMTNDDDQITGKNNEENNNQNQPTTVESNDLSTQDQLQDEPALPQQPSDQSSPIPDIPPESPIEQKSFSSSEQDSSPTPTNDPKLALSGLEPDQVELAVSSNDQRAEQQTTE